MSVERLGSDSRTSSAIKPTEILESYEAYSLTIQTFTLPVTLPGSFTLTS